MSDDEVLRQGHRKRLRDRILASNIENIAEDELLEFILCLALPRRDVKMTAKKLIADFGDINTLLNTEKDKLLSHDLITENIALTFVVMREVLRRKLQSKLMQKNVISSWQDILEYLKRTMGGLKTEQFRILFLNKRNQLIADEIIASGTIDYVAIYPREIVKRALFHEAGAVILVHNHPGGSTEPSKDDINITKLIENACESIDITLHDHVIVTESDYFSFKSNLLL